MQIRFADLSGLICFYSGLQTAMRVTEGGSLFSKLPIGLFLTEKQAIAKFLINLPPSVTNALNQEISTFNDGFSSFEKLPDGNFILKLMENF